MQFETLSFQASKQSAVGFDTSVLRRVLSAMFEELVRVHGSATVRCPPRMPSRNRPAQAPLHALPARAEGGANITYRYGFGGQTPSDDVL